VSKIFEIVKNVLDGCYIPPPMHLWKPIESEKDDEPIMVFEHPEESCVQLHYFFGGIEGMMRTWVITLGDITILLKTEKASKDEMAYLDYVNGLPSSIQ